MELLYELKGPLFEKAKALIESFGPIETYVAIAVHATEGYRGRPEVTGARSK
jgi:hypothetical protein